MLRIDRSEFVPFPLERVAQFISAVDQLNTFNILQWWWRMRWYLPIHEVYFCVDSLLTHPRCALHTAWKRNKRVKAAWNFASAAFSLRFIFTCGGSALYHWVLTYMQGLLTHLAHLCCRKKYKKVVFFSWRWIIEVTVTSWWCISLYQLSQTACWDFIKRLLIHHQPSVQGSSILGQTSMGISQKKKKKKYYDSVRWHIFFSQVA